VLRVPMGPTERTYVKNRYDQNIRYIDDQLQRVFDALDEQDTVIFLADHGEEFWDHGDFEHGHTLYDELLRVPLIVKAPGLKPDRVEQPVSLLDVAPTLLGLAGLDHPDMDGIDLGPVLAGDRSARQALSERDIAFGRLLYGDTQWGTLRGDEKYVTRNGEERVFHVDQDPGERLDERPSPEAAATYRDRLAKALGTPVRVGFRVIPNEIAGWPSDDLVAQLTVPGGVDDAFPADDPTGHSFARVAVTGDTVTIVWPRTWPMMREVFIVPKQPFAQAKEGLQAHLVMGRQATDYTLGKDYDLRPHRHALALLVIGGRTVRIDREVIPMPTEGGQALRGYDDELSSMLQAMGYAVGGQPNDNDDAGSGSE
jgi:Sulfatase